MLKDPQLRKAFQENGGIKPQFKKLWVEHDVPPMRLFAQAGQMQ